MADQPTARQAEYLAFIRTYTKRRHIPPSFEEIGDHFVTTAPSVNSMIKRLEALGFLARVPGAARTLRVLVPEAAAPVEKPPAVKTATDEVERAVQLGAMVIERLVPVLKGLDEQLMSQALDAVAAAVDLGAQAAGATASRRCEARETLRRAALAALGLSDRRVWRRTPPG